MSEKDRELLDKARSASWEDILHMVPLADSEETRTQLTILLNRKFRKDEQDY